MELQKTNMNISCRSSRNCAKSVIFSGASHCIGTSTVAANFALRLSTDKCKRVLLINADYRSMRESKIFSEVSTDGLSEILTNQCSARSVIDRNKKDNLYLLPKGRSCPQPVDLFELPQFSNLLDLMREKFDYLILDGPPAVGYFDTQIIASKVDGVILVVESGKTRRQVALRAKQEFENMGARVLGVILNKRRYYIPEWIYRRL